MILNTINISPEWVSAIAAAIGVPLAVWGFWKLVRHDKDRQTEVQALVGMVNSLKEQIAELGKQTNILSQQFYLKDTIARANHKPEFQLDHQGTFIMKTGFRITVINKGKRAVLVKFANEQNFKSFDWSTKIDFQNAVIETEKEFLIDASYIPYDTRFEQLKNDREEQEMYALVAEPFKEKFTFDLIFQDALGNCYSQRITGNENPGYTQGSCKIDKPEIYHLLDN